MAASELTIEEMREYFIKNGGSISNREVVRHFKYYLTDPATKDDARQKFKVYINKLATSKMEGDQKVLSLRPMYYNNSAEDTSYPVSPKHDPRNSIGIPTSPVSPLTNSPFRAPPPYRPPPPVVSSPSSSIYDTISLSSSTISLTESIAPQVPPRRKTNEKNKVENNCEKENEVPDTQSSNDDKIPISVKERTQKFNRLASIEDELSSPTKSSPNKSKKQKDKGVDEDDGATLTPLEPKQCSAWYVAAAKADYHELCKLASKESRLVKVKDPFMNVLHWAAKHGNVDIIKLFAGTYKVDVHAKTNGGYTPLHLAAQFDRKEVFDILTEVYKADRNIRDYSGKKPEQYMMSRIQAKTSNKNKIKYKKNKNGEKDLSFLRIGSLNVRVKKTTEAVSSFLGVGGNSGSNSTIEPILEKVHKGWGSADNIGQDEFIPAQKIHPVKRKAKRPVGQSGVSSNPGTPNQPQRMIQRHSSQDSDSDSAAGFDSNWKN